MFNIECQRGETGRTLQILEQVAVYKPPTVQLPGMYSLKAAAFAEFDPFFWFRNSKKAEVRKGVHTTLAVSRDARSGALRWYVAFDCRSGALELTLNLCT